MEDKVKQTPEGEEEYEEYFSYEEEVDGDGQGYSDQVNFQQNKQPYEEVDFFEQFQQNQHNSQVQEEIKESFQQQQKKDNKIHHVDSQQMIQGQFEQMMSIGQESKSIDILAKEELINKEILEKGHAPQDFEYYLQKIKADSQDLNKWGFEELRNVIMEFQDHQFAQAMVQEEQMMQGMTRQGPQVNYFNPIKADERGQPLVSNDKVKQIMPFLNRYEHGPFLQVTQLKPSILNQQIKKLSIKVGNPRVVEIKEFLFIKANQLQVTVFTNPLKWETIRSEPDFYQLRKLIQLQFPHLLLPPLPSKTESKFTSRSMTQRCAKLNRFLSALMRNEEICTNQFVIEFLQTKHKEVKIFGEKMKNEENQLLKNRKEGKPDINELSSMYDKVATEIQSEAVAFDLPLFIDRFETLNKAIIEDAKLITVKSADLHQSYLKFQDLLMRKSQFHEDDGSTQQLEIWGHLSKIFGTDAFLMQSQGDSILSAMKYLKYNIEYASSMRELQVKAEHTKQRFVKADKNFNYKREKVTGQLGQENQAKISQVMIDSMLPVESQELEKATQLMNFFTNKVLSEVRKMQLGLEQPGMHENFQKLTREYTDVLNQRSMQWANLLKNLDDNPNQQHQIRHLPKKQSIDYETLK